MPMLSCSVGWWGSVDVRLRIRFSCFLDATGVGLLTGWKWTGHDCRAGRRSRWFAIVPVRWICALDIMQQDCACDLFLSSLCAPLLSASVSSGVYFVGLNACHFFFPPFLSFFFLCFLFPFAIWSSRRVSYAIFI